MSWKLEWVRTNLFHPVKSAPLKCKFFNFRQHDCPLVTFRWHRSTVRDYISTIKLFSTPSAWFSFLCKTDIQYEKSSSISIYMGSIFIIKNYSFTALVNFFSVTLLMVDHQYFLQYIICHFQSTVLTNGQKRKWALIWPFVTEKWNPIRHHRTTVSCYRTNFNLLAQDTYCTVGTALSWFYYKERSLAN